MIFFIVNDIFSEKAEFLRYLLVRRMDSDPTNNKPVWDFIWFHCVEKSDGQMAVYR